MSGSRDLPGGQCPPIPEGSEESFFRALLPAIAALESGAEDAAEILIPAGAVEFLAHVTTCESCRRMFDEARRTLVDSIGIATESKIGIGGPSIADNDAPA
jgi:hypothetical protein